MFTNNDNVRKWLANDANIESEVGGKYELFWDEDNKKINSTIDCKITAIESNKLLSFEWRGPVQFADFMNTSNSLTHVVVLFLPCSNHSIEIHLIHAGWKDDVNWERARLWFDEVWRNALGKLEGIVTL